MKVQRLVASLRTNGVSFFTGVPDSLLKEFCSFLSARIEPRRHIIAANEGAAIALATGYHLATGSIPLVYMQNSGLGNAVNPLTSLADSEVYGIPILLVIGWRGEPGEQDEPQHCKMGRIMLQLLDNMEIGHELITRLTGDPDDLIERVCDRVGQESRPFALIVKRGTFEAYVADADDEERYSLTREQAIQSVVDCLLQSDVVVSTTGMASRELFEYRELLGHGHGRDFLTVGSMGHCSQIALGVALEKRKRRIYCFDGDGAVIMHMGSLATIGALAPENLVHIVLNNSAHDSVGGQPTVGHSIDLVEIARACGYKRAIRAVTSTEVKNAISILSENAGPTFLEIRVKRGHRKNLGRPTATPVANKLEFIHNLRE